MKVLTQAELDDIEQELKAMLPGAFAVSYDPKFPQRDESTFSWLQIVFAVGPGTDRDTLDQVHTLYSQVITLMLEHRVQQYAEVISLRARRHTEQSSPDHPHMFVEAAWNAGALAKLQEKPEEWHKWAYFYANRFDKNDPLNKVSNNTSDSIRQPVDGSPKPSM